MQGQRSTIGSFPETIDFDQGSVSNNTGMNQQTSWNNMLNPAESRLSNYMLSSSEANFARVNAVSHDGRSFSGWDSGEPSSSANPQTQVVDDGTKMEQDWYSPFGAHARAGPRLEERQLEPTNTLLRESVNIGLNSNQVTGGPLILQSSSSNRIPQNVNLNAGYVGNGGSGGQGMGAGVCPNLYRSGGSESKQISSASAPDNGGTSSGSSGYLVEENDIGSGSSLGNWGSSCKRKALEGTSGQSYPGGSSSCVPQAENSVWHTVPARYNASSSLSISTPPVNSPTTSPSEQMNARIGVGTRGVASDIFPSLGVTGNAESSLRNFGRRANLGHQQESVPFNLSSTGSARRSNVCSPHQSSRLLPFSDALDLRSAEIVAANTSAPQSQSRVMNIPGFFRNAPPFPWNGASNSRAGTSSSSLILSGERGSALREEGNLRSIPRNNAEHQMFVPPTETRNLAHDPTNWSLATGNISTPGGIPSTSRIGPNSSGHPSPTPGWIPHFNPPTQNQQSLPEFAPWTLFPSVDSESGGHSGPFPPLPSGPSASSQETVTSSGANSHAHQQPYPRSALLIERQGDDVLGMQHSWRALAADIEGRHRLISEIRQVLNAMRRGENLRAEDYMLFDPFIYHGMAELQDRHRDMRLDVDNMSYEELLALEERIGNVSTGLNEETILKCMKQRKYISIRIGSPSDLEPCCICQEEYATGDDLGMLDCGHDFHTNCIKQWLAQKNLCPICKTTALVT